MFPLGSYAEARTAQASYVQQFEAKGLAKVSDSTSNSLQQSEIGLQPPHSSRSIGIEALGFNTDTGAPALDIYIPTS